RWKEVASHSPDCIFHLKPFRRPRKWKCNQIFLLRLLEEAGVLVKHGMENGPKEGTHIRFCIMNPEDTMEEILSRLSSFHTVYERLF
ncbi:alanine aminotransferase 1-like, partial [Gymnodraco acuticeps]|uniref:Alanine aminotransferase 1-like n=1 Tax=Gymnodraco acuticeps TaxID=8218 RepID=A0A6P8TPA6_GYMAC